MAPGRPAPDACWQSHWTSANDRGTARPGQRERPRFSFYVTGGAADQDSSGKPWLGSAPVSKGLGPSDRNRHQPAAATMAALSVHIDRDGRKARTPVPVHMSRTDCRMNLP